MKKFFRSACFVSASLIGDFVVVSLFLALICGLILSGSLGLQLLSVLLSLCAFLSGVLGAVIILIDFVRRLLDRKKKSAPTEVSAE